MAGAKHLKRVRPRAGEPLYQVVQHAICDAIDAGLFAPGEQMPSTKHLSEQLGVSLVTAHRALQELVQSGVLERAQGRGTFVHHRYFQRRRIAAAVRVGLVFHREASLADYYHGQILDGVHRAAAVVGIDLILLRFGEDVRNECDGYLLVNPFPEDLGKLADDLRRGHPTLVVGAQSHLPNIPSFDVDNVSIAKLAVEHLAAQGHRRIGYVGGAYKISNSRDRWQGFSEACDQLKLDWCDANLVKGAGWKLDGGDLAALAALMRGRDRPTALFAAGYSFALDVYATAAAAKLKIPDDVSLVGVDDPPGAAHLAPPMTTVRQPLATLGEEAVLALAGNIREGDGHPLQSRRFAPELLVRKSVAPTGSATAEPRVRSTE